MNTRLPLKLAAWTIALMLVALPVVGVLNGWFAVDRWPVKYLQVEAQFEHVSAAQIRATVATQLGTGFFALDLEHVRHSVAALPWVASVEARKRWPDTLVLLVREHQPFARWGAKRLIDRDGGLFSVPGGNALQGLPQLDGPDGALGDVVDFYTRTGPMLSGTGLILTGVRLTPRGSWTLTLAGGAQIRLGDTDVVARLQRFIDVYPQIGAGHAAGFEHADLRYTNGFAIRWLAEPAQPASPQAARSAGGNTTTGAST